jgi:tRNA threonylcarbamoyladenosine dehydratase
MVVSPIFSRLNLLTGEDVLQALHSTSVIIFGVGGVGSWIADSLIRSGIHRLTLVDSDTVCITNVNRQLQATTKNVGQSKVEELKSRLLELNPKATIETHLDVYEVGDGDKFQLGQYDYVIDAIDSIRNKVDLCISATEAGSEFYSSMGAAYKLDPTQIEVTSIWDTQNDPLARHVRKGLRQRNFKGDFQVVYSRENLPLMHKTSVDEGTHQCFCPSFHTEKEGLESAQDWCHSKAVIPGSAVHITATFGQHLSGLVIQDVYHKIQKMLKETAV